MKVLIAPDKFKGSLTALEVAEYLATGLRRVRGIQTTQLPLVGELAAALRVSR